MPAASATARKSANSKGAVRCTKMGKALPLISIVMRAARTLWPAKASLELADRTGASERMCKYWLAEKYELSAEHLVRLLRSDEGFTILEAVMGDERPQWWRKFKRSAQLAALRKQQAEARKAIEQLELDLAAD